MKTIALFSHYGRIGSTTLLYHLAWMYAELGVRVLAVDLDPQAHLSSMLLDPDDLEAIWLTTARHQTTWGAIAPVFQQRAPLAEPAIHSITEHLGLLVGDVAWAEIEGQLASGAAQSPTAEDAALRLALALRQLLHDAAAQHEAQLILLDVGSNTGILNRVLLSVAEALLLPLAPNLAAWQALPYLGATLQRWQPVWQHWSAAHSPALLPATPLQPLGYVVMHHAVRLDQPLHAADRWLAAIPAAYRAALCPEAAPAMSADVADDPLCLALLKPYRSLMDIAKEARKPMFLLKPADGALGNHGLAVHACYRDFRGLAQRIAAGSVAIN
ncbi:MAG: ParA family protein [Candidatus Viridilinea halotolerans]|uniref:ParA family protein n=1 Tax=Candidatus Viridilinea halotolerans TaxID=2491704 RepID=A0A426TW27_9CHLR|nr:MAG: ParA family protein [Candidatus Viridilinea halotolerans]